MPLPPDVEDACRRAGALWLRLDTDDRHRLAWHLWRDGAAWVVAGGGEPDLPGATEATGADVLVPDRERVDARHAWRARVHRVVPGTSDWDQHVPHLAAARLNGPADLATWWAAASTVLRLAPVDALRDDGHG